MKEVVSQKTIVPSPNLVERTVARVFPDYGMKLYRNRATMMMLGYTGASKKQRTLNNWNTPSGDFDTDILPDLPALRERSEDLYRNNMMASSAINTPAISVVGRGLTAQPRVDAKALGLSDDQADEWEAIASRYWSMWSESKHCTVNKKLNFREYQGTAFISAAVRGDCFTLTPEKKPDPFHPFRLRLQLVEADRVCNEDNQADTPNLSGGIATNADGSLKDAHIMTTHPGSQYGQEAKWVKRSFFGAKTGRRNVLHLYRSIRGDQSRGVPDLAPVIEGLKQFATLTQASIDAAVIQTFLTVFIETPDGGGLGLEAGEPGQIGKPSNQKLEAAAIIDLAEGEIPHFLNPTHPNSNFGAFAEQFQIQLGAALGIPKEVLVKHFQSSYSAAQAALLEAWRFFMVRRSWLIDNLCQPVYELFITEMIAEGKLSAPGFFNDPMIRSAYLGADWVGPPRGHIRDDVQNKADATAEDRGWKTSAQNCQERGGTFERNHRQRVKEVKARIDGGLITVKEDENSEDIKVDE